ncbi:MAG TPA: tyrosine-type recombinase/integrase, partial [Thermoleophilia bacterium]|nr:tyrosine-type recombinase/integrase [Thermoleophilia bacterium]
LLEAYEQHQQCVRGLRPRTLQGYQYVVRQFLRATLGEDPIDVTRLRSADVVAFVMSIRPRFCPSSMRTVGTSLRSFFRYLRVEGLCDSGLEEAIPAVARWKVASLPRGLSDAELERLVASLGVATLCGRRDRAIVLCLATLGLRPGEVAELQLEDIDWRTGTLHLRTRKTRRGSVLPLPRQAGLAIVEYLREERPQSCARQVFLRHSGGRKGGGISAGIVTGAVIRALKRAEIDAPIAGAYVLRHTVATSMVRQGVKLKEVSDFLGHRDLDTTTIYAKVDLTALRDVALPWPEVTS